MPNHQTYYDLDDSEKASAAISGAFSKETLQIAQIVESMPPTKREMVLKRLQRLVEALSLDLL